MEKFHFFNMFFLLFLLQFSFLFVRSSDDNPPSYNFTINCGSKSTVTVDGRSFVGDVNSGSSFPVGKSKPIQEDRYPSTSIALYQTARVFQQPSSYEFDVTKNGTYMVRLHFYIFTSKKFDLGDAQFNVSASRISLLSNFKVQKNSSLPVIKEFLVTAVNVDKFKVNFIPAQETSFAFVNAIEVLLTPKNYGLASPDDAPFVTSRGSNGTSHGLLSGALQTIHRINIGGPFVGPDTVLWRNWTTDENFLLPGSSRNTCPATDSPINYKDREEDAYYAPKLVYKTCREANSDEHVSSIAWRFDVNKNASHLVRAHFCELSAIAPNTVSFSLIIYSLFNQTINPTDKKIFRAGGAPFYYDFVVNSDYSGFINISISTQDGSMIKTAYLNGLEIMEFMKEPGKELGSLPVTDKQDKKRTFIISGSVGGVAIILISIMGFFWSRKCWKAKQVETTVSEAMPSHGDGRTVNASPVINLNLKLIMPFAEILEATQNFDSKFLIGEGGFGKVYKGILKSGQKVAVKRSDSKHGQGLPEFQTEVLLLSKIRYRHLVSLIGYCNEGSEMILVYEFMDKGTLRDHLYSLNGNLENSFTQAKLTWRERLEICIGSAKGLHYLHSGSNGGIIHRDVKSTNILLDENYTAKVADFGLSRSGPFEGADSFSIGVKGSFGYLDPEFFRSLQFTDKSDVYSFGVVLLEVLCARPAISNTTTRREEINLADWGLLWLKNGQLEEIVDPFLLGKINPNSLRKFGELVGKCLKENGVDRPTMRDVLWDLEYALQLEQTAVHRNPLEDSTKDTSLELELPPAWCLHSNNFPAEEEVPMSGDDTSGTTASQLFSQLRIDGAR
ncbi:hypothetical protein ACOSP7_023228 [Xanthoceras sorbifolium]